MNGGFPGVSPLLLAFAIGLVGGKEAHAAQDLVIDKTFINEVGDLEINFSDVLPAPTTMRYDANTNAELTYVCADNARRPLAEGRYRQTVRTMVERSVQFSTGFMGQVRGFVTLNYLRNQENLLCPPGTSPTLAVANYSEIQLRNQFGVSATTRNMSHIFIRLSARRSTP
ncbi:MAG TPA: hypothetical protein PK156_10190 [Polyangium sp.]|nr:hypothetical protein [Polyangium sp.]